MVLDLVFFGYRHVVMKPLCAPYAAFCVLVRAREGHTHAATLVCMVYKDMDNHDFTAREPIQLPQT